MTRLLQLVLLLAFVTPVSAQEQVRDVRLQLKWTHQFQGAGFYQAVEQGFYRDAGLSVTLIENRPDQDPAEVVLAGDAEFGVATSGLVIHRAEGHPVVALASLFQHSPYVVVAREGDDLRMIHDLVGKRLMVEGSSDELLAYLALEHVPLESIEVVPHEGSVTPLVEGRVDAMTAYTSTEPFLLDELGFPYQILDPRASGIDYYGDILFTTEGLVEDDPELVRAFVDASLAGWRYAMDHMDETIDLILAEYAPELERGELVFEAAEIHRLMMPEMVPVGHMYEGRWRRIAEGYQAAGLISDDFTLDGFLYDQEDDPDLSRFYLLLFGVLAFAGLVTLILIRFQLLNNRLRDEMTERFRAEEELREAACFLQEELESQERDLEVLARDLADRKRELQDALEMAEAARERAEEASRTKSRFLAAISHELRAPLTAILGNAELLSSEAEGRERAHAEAVGDAARRLDALIDEILTLAGRRERTTPGRSTSTDLVALAREVVEENRSEAEASGLSLELEAPETVEVRTDPARVHEALAQLIHNGIRFTESGGVTVRVGPGPRIEVRDTGPGIPEEHLDRIFEPFTQLADPQTRKVGGAGVGLALARGMIESLGGEIHWREAPDGGSIFTLTIPDRDGARPIPTDLAGTSILVVDDDRAVRAVMARALRREGAEVVEARDVPEAIQALEAQPFHLLLSDVSMPGRTGISLGEEARNRWPEMAIVLVSGAELDEFETRSARGVSEAFIRKPFAVDVLASTLREALGERSG